MGTFISRTCARVYTCVDARARGLNALCIALCEKLGRNLYAARNTEEKVINVGMHVRKYLIAFGEKRRKKKRNIRLEITFDTYRAFAFGY